MREDGNKSANRGLADKTTIRLAADWRDRIGDYLLRPDMQALAAFLRAERARGVTVYPPGAQLFAALDATAFDAVQRSEEHTSELQSLMRISYAVFCLKKKKNIIHESQKHD